MGAKDSCLHAVQKAIRGRKTEKVIGDPAEPVKYSTEQLNRGDSIVRQAIADCGWAPFHYNRNQDGVAEPWRVWWMSCDVCRQVLSSIDSLVPNLKPTGKLPALLAGCGSLTLFTWSPLKKGDSVDSTKLERINREHLAATAAAVQNFLLLLTASGLPNYWSSGTLIEDHLFDQLGIPSDHILTAAVFVHYPECEGSVEILTGKQRANRSDVAAWCRDVSLQN